MRNQFLRKEEMGMKEQIVYSSFLNENLETPEVPIKKISIGNNGSFSENNKHDKHQEEDKEVTSSENLIIKNLTSIGEIAQYRIVFLTEEKLKKLDELLDEGLSDKEKLVDLQKRHDALGIEENNNRSAFKEEE
ncbi:1957_t:CDS:2 [Dentiscutata erythropus]|uniref:1957_t:CDS:1 n=1 Tax=Dentiscutata erythropus TaxID=1348616 RepID=A0A9N8ZN38_9GLOM|nr:1957_t:CDS:2 [Dentiscutata erythropus]